MSDPLPAPVPDCIQCSEIQQLQGQVRQLQERVRELEPGSTATPAIRRFPPRPIRRRRPSLRPSCRPDKGPAGNTAVPAGITTDLDGNAQFVDDLATVDTDSGEAPIVDMDDFGIFQRCYSGERNPANPNCAN